MNRCLELWKTFEVRYQVAKKFGFRGTRVVSLHLLIEVVKTFLTKIEFHKSSDDFIKQDHINLFDEKTTDSLFILRSLTYCDKRK